MQNIRLTAAAAGAIALAVASVSPASATVPKLLHNCDMYLCDTGNAQKFLAGSHTWNQSQKINGWYIDGGFPAFVNWETKIGTTLNASGVGGGNFIRYWTWSQSDEGDGPIDDNQLPYLRSTTCCANDGGNKWDLTKWNSTFWTKMAADADTAAQSGIYLGVIFFQSEFLTTGYMATSWANDPLNPSNNINGTSGTNGSTSQQNTNSTTTNFQKAYVDKFIDTLHGKTNVIYEIDNEPQDATATLNWENLMADEVTNYENAHSYVHHPVGITAIYPDGSTPTISNSTLYSDTHSDWTSLYGWFDFQSNPPDALDTNHKPAFVDSDHGGSGSGKDGTWVWEMATRGYSPLEMDDMGGTSFAPAAGGHDGFATTDTTQIAMLKSARAAQGNAVWAFSKLHLGYSDYKPYDSRSSTGYAIGSPSHGEWIIFAPSGGTFTMNLTGYSGTLNKQWINVGTGVPSSVTTFTGGSSSQSFTAPNSVNALVLTPTAGVAATLAASPDTITSGNSSTLTWSSTNATSCTSPDFTVTATSGTASVSPTVTTVYELDCSNSTDSSITLSLVTVQ